MFKKDLNIITLMLELITKIQDYSGHFDSSGQFVLDNKSFDATMMNNEFKAKYNQIELRLIYDFRNLIAHDYFGIDEEEIWDIIQYDLLVSSPKSYDMFSGN